MDSSRSGLFSTLLMTLPLIVVPAIALLRPPGHAAGVSTSALDASDSSDEDFLNDLNDLSDLETALDGSQKATKKASRQFDSSEFDGLFEEPGADEGSDTSSTGTDDSDQIPDRTKDRDANPFMPFDTQEGDGSGMDPANDASTGSAAEKIVEHLNSHGALKTMWFEAGPKSPVGFAAFFRGQTDLMRIRFEAVGQTREECARNVLDQVTQWQADAAAEKP